MKAAEHYDGKGLQDGIDSTNTLGHVRNMKTKSVVNYQYKVVLESIMAACSWPAARIKTIIPPNRELCTRCGLYEQTDFHVFWQCKCNREIDHECVSEVQDLYDQALDNHEQSPCG